MVGTSLVQPGLVIINTTDKVVIFSAPMIKSSGELISGHLF